MITIDTPQGPQDWAAIRHICCETAYGGAGLPEASRWDFFGRLWVGPYERLLPDWTLAVRDGGKLIGYLTGCPDTAAFESRRRWLHDAPLALRILSGGFPFNQDTRTFLRRWVGLEKAPNQRFSQHVQQTLPERYPAHLHMNLTAGHRGQGIGLLLLEEFFKRLRANKVAGVHVHCAQGPLGFYQKAGFSIMERQELASGDAVFVLTKDLNQ